MPASRLQRCERGDEHHRRAVRTRDDPLRCLVHVVGVHLRDDERDVRVHAEGRGVVDDLGAGRHGVWRPLGREVVLDVHDDEVQAVEAAGPQHLARDLAGRERELAALRTVRGEGPQLGHGKRPLLQDPEHLAADQPGRTHQPDAHAVGRSRRGHQPAPSSNASCRTRTAFSTSPDETTQEMRIDDVEIISMLTPSFASVSNIVAATPGWVFIPAPTSETRPMSSSAR